MKTKLLHHFCLKEDSFGVVWRQTFSPVVEPKFLDGAAIVQMLDPGATKSFQEYVDEVFIPYISRQLETAKRIDVVWDV